MVEGHKDPASAAAEASAAPGEEGSAAGGRRARSSSGRSGPQSQPLVAALGKFSLRATGLLSPALGYRLGGWLGWVYSFLPTKDNHTAKVNLKLCFGDLSAAERKRLRRSSFQHTGRFFLELGRIWHGGVPGDPGYACTVRGEDVLERALAQGKGALILVPHLGSWEITGVFLARKYAVTGLYRSPRVQEMDAVYRHGRERHGPKLFAAGASGVRGIQRALQRGEVACVLPDQDPGRGAGVFVPFFGQTANTGTLFSRLASRTGSPVVTAYSKRMPGGDFELVLGEGDPEISHRDPDIGTAAVNRTVERCVREAPEQYLWSYKRFRFQPKGSPSPYKLPHPEGF